jgi:hypothetical protein
MLCDRMYLVCQKQVKDLAINNYVLKRSCTNMEYILNM